ncbi:MAG TPA: HD domain-containing phosphohydrolase [Dissulfurispiraceae bacterium]|nr:HD domain-containing phosphohydrolase [Dissulfurispiraceae bacterium]
MDDNDSHNPMMKERCRKIGSDGSVCISMNAHLMSCLSDMLINKVWPPLEFLKMVKSGDIEMSPEIIDIVIRDLDAIVNWMNFLKEKSAREEHIEVTFVDRRADAEGHASQLANLLIAEKVMNRDMIQRLAALAEFRDSANGNHILRVGLCANKVSEMLDMPMSFIDRISVASTLHDIGKMGIPTEILFKPGPLTPEEFAYVRNHTVIGHRILGASSNPVMQMAAEIALTHHENYDGSGYPGGLKGREIPLAGLIVHICDVYDTLRSRRPYKEPLGHKKAISIIVNGDDKSRREHFHPVVLDAFLELCSLIEEIYETHKEG